MFFACNALPDTFDKSAGYFRRLQIIPFLKKFDKNNKDVHLDKKLEKELDGIFMFAIEVLKRLAQKR